MGLIPPVINIFKQSATSHYETNNDGFTFWKPIIIDTFSHVTILKYYTHNVQTPYGYLISRHFQQLCLQRKTWNISIPTKLAASPPSCTHKFWLQVVRTRKTGGVNVLKWIQYVSLLKHAELYRVVSYINSEQMLVCQHWVWSLNS